MADKTNIEWADASWTPVKGCTRESEGCRNCYAEVMADEVGKPLMCFGTANDGQPRHTLMLAYETPLVVWRPPQ